MSSPLSLEKLGHNLPASGLAAASQAAMGFGAGLLLSGYLDRGVRHKLAVGMLTAGAAVVLPFIVGVVTRVSNRPESARRVRKQLESIRQDHGLDEHSEALL
jgi:hypothetical protein